MIRIRLQLIMILSSKVSSLESSSQKTKQMALIRRIMNFKQEFFKVCQPYYKSLVVQKLKLLILKNIPHKNLIKLRKKLQSSSETSVTQVADLGDQVVKMMNMDKRKRRRRKKRKDQNKKKGKVKKMKSMMRRRKRNKNIKKENHNHRGKQEFDFF